MAKRKKSKPVIVFSIKGPSSRLKLVGFGQNEFTFDATLLGVTFDRVSISDPGPTEATITFKMRNPIVTVNPRRGRRNG